MVIRTFLSSPYLRLERHAQYRVSSFYFNYLQIHGTPTVTKMAPSFVNLFLFQSLRKRSIQPHTRLRFFDDIFMIWTEGPEKLKLLPIN